MPSAALRDENGEVSACAWVPKSKRKQQVDEEDCTD